MRAACLLPLCAALLGCGIDLDPDSLVQHLRLLGARTGDEAAKSSADLALTDAALKLNFLVAAPAGPGRRVQAPRTLRADLSLCLTPTALLVPGAVDDDCLKRGAQRGDLPALSCPPADQPLMPLALRFDPTLPLAVPQGPIFACLQQRLGSLLGMGGGMGGGFGGLPTSNGVLEVRLPLVIDVRADGSDDPLDSEIGFFFPRLVVALSGTPPPANHNPALQPIGYSFAEDDPAPQALAPCPAQGECTRLRVRRDQPVFLTARAQAGSAEVYKPLDQSGREQASEFLRFSWFSTDGQFSELRTGEKLPTTRWENTGNYAAPPEVKVVQIWLVAQDGREGADWQRYELELTD